MKKYAKYIKEKIEFLEAEIMFLRDMLGTQINEHESFPSYGEWIKGQKEQ